MNVSEQLDGSLWATQGNIQIEVYTGGANKYKAEQLVKRYECSEIETQFVELAKDIKDLEKMLKETTELFNGEIIEE